MEYTLFYPTPWNEVDEGNDNIDVCLTFHDGRSFTFVVATPDNLKWLMAKDAVSYVTPGAPFLIVEKLTPEIISQLIAQIVKDEALLRTYGSNL